MIRFEYFITKKGREYRWSDLLSVLGQISPGRVIMSRLEWVEILRTVEKQWGYRVVDELMENARVTLYFDTPEKELMFKLKYL